MFAVTRTLISEQSFQIFNNHNVLPAKGRSFLIVFLATLFGQNDFDSAFPIPELGFEFSSPVIDSEAVDANGRNLRESRPVKS